MSQPFYNPTTGIRIDTGLNLDAQASSLSEIKRTMYSLCDSPENINLICESCTLEEADSFLNIGTTLIAEAVTAVYNRLDSKMSALVRVFKRYLPSNIKAMDYPSIGPDRKNGLFAYKTATFTFDDGQTVSILFHSPTADPKKFKPSETLIAYRWLLNKRDITAVVSPENGRDITLQVMAKRMMELVEANHDKFIAAQAKSDEQVKQLQELEVNRNKLQEEVDSLTQNNADLATDIAAADKEIEKLIGKLEKMPMPAQAEAEPSPVSDEANLPAEPTKINPEPLPDAEVKTAPIEQEPNTAATAASNIGGMGSKLDKSLNVTQIASLIRKEIKEKISSEFKVSVRKTSRNAIAATLTDIPDSMQLYDDEYLEVLSEHTDSSAAGVRMYTPPTEKVISDIRDIGNQYRYDNSDPMTDYFETNFYWSASVDTGLSVERRESETENYKSKLKAEILDPSIQPIEQPVTNTEELPLDELPEPVTEPESTKAEDTELPPAEPVKAEPQQSKSLYDLDNELFKSIKGNLDAINNIDEGRESWDRSSFVNSITGKLKTRAKNGEADIVDAALFYIAGRNKTVAKDMILGRNSVWKLTGKDSAYYAKGSNAIKVSGEVMPTSVPEENIATMLPIDITTIKGNEVLFTKDGLSYASLVDNPKDYKVGIMEMVEEQAEAAPQVMAGDEDAVVATNEVELEQLGANGATEILTEMSNNTETPPQVDATPEGLEPAAVIAENSADPLEQVRADLIALLGEADSTAALDTLERLMDEGEALGMDIDNDPDMLAASNHITQLLEGEQ